jgi:hypothetical protein
MASDATDLLNATLALARAGHAHPLAAAITQQEAAGQATMTEGALLPQEICNGARADLEAMGIRFGAPEDDLFVRVQLPAGWRIQGTSHAMHSHLLDEQGRKRAGLFYKAAFYDRKADLTLTRRFSIASHEPCTSQGVPHPEGPARQVVVLKDDQPIHVVGHYDRLDWKGESTLRQAAEAWLSTHWPKWANVNAYWDVP